MAKDDYFVLVYKILKYLYKCLKSGASPDFNYLTYETKDFPVHKEYWEYIIEKLVEEKYIEGVYVLRSDTNFISVKYTSGMRITPLGIEYLEDNKIMKKVAKAVKDIASLIP